MPNSATPSNRSRMERKSFLYDRIVPAAFVVFGIATLTLILFALGVLLGLVQF
jgi:hypothetical protein